MKYGIYYESVTGNTEKLARAISGVLPAQACKAVALTARAEEPLPELLFIGFWTDKGICPPATQSLLTGLHGKKSPCSERQALAAARILMAYWSVSNR